VLVNGLGTDSRLPLDAQSVGDLFGRPLELELLFYLRNQPRQHLTRLIAVLLPLVGLSLRLLGPVAPPAAVTINFPANRASIESELVRYLSLVYSTVTVRLYLKAIREGDPTVFHVVLPHLCKR